MSKPREFAPEFFAALENLHGEIDRNAAKIAALHEDCLVCKPGCSDCCQDDLTVLEIEAAWILAHREQWTEPASGPHPAGQCAFLTAAGHCRVYPWRPYVCRTQGLPLRWLEEDGQEGRGTCPLNAAEFTRAGTRLEDLPGESLWTLGEYEGRLASLQAEASGEFSQVRIPLRDLMDECP